MNVIVYTTATCPFCKMLMSYLNEKAIAFTEKRVDDDKEAAEEMMEVSGGFLGVPFTVIEKNGTKESIVGFDQNKLGSVFSEPAK